MSLHTRGKGVQVDEEVSKKEADAHFGELLRSARVSAGLSVRQLRDATIPKKKGKTKVQPRVSIALISLVESHKRVPTYDISTILASTLNIDIKTALEATYRSRVNHLHDCIEKERGLMEACLRERR